MLVFQKNKQRLPRTEDDILILFTDARFPASMMVFYLGHMIGDELKMEFVFRVGNLNGPTGNELNIMERDTKQCEKLLEWMTPKIDKQILISRSTGSGIKT